MKEESEEDEDLITEEDDNKSKDDGDVVLTKTDDNVALVGKYYLQWVLIIGIHLSVFWWFPNKINNLVQQHPYCDFSDKLTSKNCNEV